MFPLLQQQMSEGDAEWWWSTPFGWKFDMHICAYSALLREISDFHEKICSDPTSFSEVCKQQPQLVMFEFGADECLFQTVEFDKFDNRIEGMAKEWFHRVDIHMAVDDPECIFRKGLLQLYVSHALAMCDFVLSMGIKQGILL